MKTPAIIFLMALAAACGKTDDSCIDKDKINKEAMCTMEYNPVCGCNGKTYGNACEAEKSGVTSYTAGACED